MQTANINGITNNQVEKFVGKRFAFYEQKWQQSKDDGGNPMSWNMAAFFLVIVWMLYRKTYQYTLIILGVILVESFIEQMFNAPLVVTYMRNIVIALCFGFYSNALYQCHVNNKISEINTAYSPGEVDHELVQQGGVSFFVMSILLVMLVLGMLFWISLQGVA